MGNTTATRPEVTRMVDFRVTVKVIKEDEGRWVCFGKQTGIVSRAKGKEEVIERNAELHRMVVRRLKRNGVTALVRFMDSRGITFDVRGEEGPTQFVSDFCVESTTGADHELRAAA